MTESLVEQRCIPCEGGVEPLSIEVVDEYLASLEQWQRNETGTEIVKKFTFKNYYHVMAFVNTVAFMAHGQGHHPDLEVSYNFCVVRYSTHAVDGLTVNDFICATKAEAIYQERPGQPK